MRIALFTALTVCGLFIGIAPEGIAPEPGQPPGLAPIDPQRVQDQDTMTWQDYRPIPGTNWADNTLPAARVLRVALVAVDFPDQPFVITMPRQSDLFGNPQVDPIERCQRADDRDQLEADFGAAVSVGADPLSVVTMRA